MTHSLQRPDASIAEEDEKEGEEKLEQRDEELLDEDGSTMDETETDATIKEENTTAELITPTDEAPEEAEGGDEPEGEDTMMQPEGDYSALGVDRDLLSGAEMQEKDNLTATEDAERHTKIADSPELN